MRWPFSKPKPPKAPLPHSTGLPHAWPNRAAAPAGDDVGALLLLACTTCGRTDLPFVDGWPDLTCQECDAAINFDSLVESGAFDDVL